jgi:hypothetical protein
MKQLIWFGVVLAVLLSVMPAAPALAEYGTPPPNWRHALFYNLGSGLCLQPQYEAPTNGLTIVQQPCNDNDLYQRWWFQLLVQDRTTPLGTYRIINSGSGQCLDDRDGRTANGSPVQQWTCNYTSNTMQWKFENGGDRYNYQFRNVRSGKCLDVRGGSLQPGAVLQIYECTGSGKPAATNPLNYAQLFRWMSSSPRY